MGRPLESSFDIKWDFSEFLAGIFLQSKVF